MKRWHIYILLAAGLFFRLWGLHADLPSQFYGDEDYLIYHSLKFGTGDLNPHWFIWPTLFQYLLFSLFGVYYVFGRIVGHFSSSADFLYHYLKDPTVFYMIGRTVSALMGTASIYLVFIMGRKIYDTKTGFLAALIFTVLPLHIKYSHFAVTDGPMVCMMLLSFVFIVMIYKDGSLRYYILSGLFTGLATATKYPASILLISLFVAHYCNIRKEKTWAIMDKRITIAVLFIAISFFAGCPFALFDHHKFLSDIRDLQECCTRGWFGWEEGSPYIYHIAHTLKDTFGAPLLLFIFAGGIVSFIRRRKEELLYMPTVIVYYLVMCRSVNVYDRFMLPVLPFLSLLSAKSFFDLEDRLKKKRKALRYVLFFLLVPLLYVPISNSILIDKEFLLVNTRTLAKDWIEKNIPAGSRILLNEGGPLLNELPEQIETRYQEKPDEELMYGYHDKRGMFYQMKQRVAAEGKNFELHYVYNPIAYLELDPGYERMMAHTMEAIQDYTDTYDYIVFTEVLILKILSYPIQKIPERYLPLRKFYEQMRELHPIKVFLPKDGSIRGKEIRIYDMRTGARPSKI